MRTAVAVSDELVLRPQQQQHAPCGQYRSKNENNEGQRPPCLSNACGSKEGRCETGPYEYLVQINPSMSQRKLYAVLPGAMVVMDVSN